MENQNKELVITRTFDAPRELVFEAFTKAEHLAHWWGPAGVKMGQVKVDLRPGGEFHYSMIAPDGTEMWGKFVYLEIVPPSRIVFVSSFSDKDANVVRAPFNSSWPAEVRNVLSLTEDNCKTTVTLVGYPINASAEECKLFEEFSGSMHEGFKGTFDQLEAYLSTLVNA